MTIAELLRKEGEARGYQKGLQKGLMETIEMGLSLRFGDESLSIMPFIQQIQSQEKLIMIRNSLRIVDDYSKFKEIIEN